MKKIVIVSASLRENSNSEILAREAEKGAKKEGNDVTFFSLKGKKIEYCIGCLACSSGQNKCAIKDDVTEMRNVIKDADVLIFASPIYYYGISGLLKNFLDRLNPLYSVDYKFRDVYLLTTAAEDGVSVNNGSKTAIQGWVDCYPKAKFSGFVFAGGVDVPGRILQKTDFLKAAFELGANA